jgi:hypothetical protein
VPLSDYNKTKQLVVEAVSGTPTVDKAQPFLVSGQVNKLIDLNEEGVLNGF